MYAETGTKFYDEKRNLLYEMQEEGTLCVNGLLHPKDERCEYDIPLEYEGFKITAIGKEAFSNKKITKIIISDSVTKIGEGAFCGSRISEIYLPSSVRIIEDAAFSSCPNLMNINVSENNCFFQSVDGVLFNKALTQILKYPAGRKNERYKIPETVLDICDRAFGDCDYLTSIDIPDSVSYLGFGAFEDCDGLSSIFIPSSVRAIEYGAIDFCKNLESITVAEDNRFFCSVEGVLFDKSMSTLCMYPRGRKESSYTIPKGVKYLKASSLHCPNMIYLNIPLY